MMTPRLAMDVRREKWVINSTNWVLDLLTKKNNVLNEKSYTWYIFMTDAKMSEAFNEISF